MLCQICLLIILVNQIEDQRRVRWGPVGHDGSEVGKKNRLVGKGACCQEREEKGVDSREGGKGADKMEREGRVMT